MPENGTWQEMLQGLEILTNFIPSHNIVSSLRSTPWGDGLEGAYDRRLAG